MLHFLYEHWKFCYVGWCRCHCADKERPFQFTWPRTLQFHSTFWAPAKPTHTLTHTCIYTIGHCQQMCYWGQFPVLISFLFVHYIVLLEWPFCCSLSAATLTLFSKYSHLPSFPHDQICLSSLLVVLCIHSWVLQVFWGIQSWALAQPLLVF